MGRLRGERPGLPAIALTTNTSLLTALANDYGFEFIFVRQIEALVAPGDVLVALSTSGTSANVVRGVDAGRKRGAFLVGMTGETGGALADQVGLLINVPSRDPQRIQEAHITIGHIVCALVEEIVFARAPAERRRSARVFLHLPVIVHGQTREKTPFREETLTLVVNVHGALFTLGAGVERGQQLVLTNKSTQEQQDCKVVHVGTEQGGRSVVALEFLRPAPKFWHIAFPPEDWKKPAG